MDAVLLGMAVIAFITMVPVGIAIVAALLWGTRPKTGTGRRAG